ncbi:hypothetical protein BH11BAC4_BH11BAC4_17120 [soil metagenome]
MQSQLLFNKLFNNAPTDKNRREHLTAVAKKYPWFSAAHFFLLKETPDSDYTFPKTAGRTVLHFNNPFLLNYKLKQVEESYENEEIKSNELRVYRVESIKKVDVVGEVDDMSAEVLEPMNVVEKVETVNEVDSVEAGNKEPEPGKAADSVKIKEPARDDEMIFEPLFATDYFASQGIKLSEEVQTGDKLGKQLKSFTEWLKTMKKVHESKFPVGNEQTDMAMQKLAEKSNQEDDIITESMAEAYLQQGKFKKAKEILEKLSLFNPSKSAYFAAKIASIAQEK